MHHFISYSRIESTEKFVFKLADALEAGPPSIATWVDQRNIRFGEKWYIELDKALKDCSSLIFIMTKDSVKDESECDSELSRALKYKKNIIPILLEQDADPPYRLDSRQYIDFSSNFESGLAKLRNHIEWIPTTEGQLQALKYRLSDTKHEIRNSNENKRIRLDKEIEILNTEIKQLEGILQNPKAAEEETQKSINARLDILRQPKREDIIDEVRVKFINSPPLKAPTYFQNRHVETKLISEFLKTDHLRIMTIKGRGGVGKTAMTCRLLNSLEKGFLPDDLGEYIVDGIVYLMEKGIHQISYSNIFEDLSKILPPDIAKRMENVNKDGLRSVRSKMITLLEEFRSRPVLVLLDNLEDFINPETQSILQDDLREALAALLEAPHHSVKVLITTRISPHDILLLHPERQRTISLDEGLVSPHAENVLRALDFDGTTGLKNASNEVLDKIREKTRGFPRALEVFDAILRADPDTSLEELLLQIENTLPQEVIEKLVGEAFSRLSKSCQMIIQVLSIFAHPIPSVAIDYVLQPYLKTSDSTQKLKLLVSMKFVRKDREKYYLHPIDLEYAKSTIPNEPVENKDKELLFSQKTLGNRAAQYYREIKKPRDEWKTLSDIEPQIAEFSIRYAVEDFDTAFILINEVDYYLTLWGYSGLVVDHRKKLLGKLNTNFSSCRNKYNLGNALLDLGMTEECIKYYTQALELSRKENHKQSEANCLNSLGIAYRRLGYILKAIKTYEMAREINQEIYASNDEGTVLMNLGVAHRYIGDLMKSIDYYEKAFEIFHNDNNNRPKSHTLSNLSITCLYMGEIEAALEYGKAALAIFKEKQDSRWEAISLARIGLCYIKLGDVSKARTYYEQSFEIVNNAANSYNVPIVLIQLGIMELLYGELDASFQFLEQAAIIAESIEAEEVNIMHSIAYSMALLSSNQIENAIQVIESIMDTEYTFHQPKILALSGLLLLRKGKMDQAKQRFEETINSSDKMLKSTPQLYEVHEAKALAACGMVLCNEEKYFDTAITHYNKARKIVSKPGVVKQALFFYTEICKADKNYLLTDIKSKVVR